MKRSLVFVLAWLGVAHPGLAGAQGTAILTGRIVDTVGAPILGAGVRVPQLERGATVDSTGRYRLEGLPAGRVTIVGEAPGFVGKRVDVVVPASGTVEQEFALRPNAHLLAQVEVRARARRQLPLHLHEFEQRRHRGMGRFLGPDDLVKFNGQPLVDAIRTITAGARFERNTRGEMIMVSSRSINAGPNIGVGNRGRNIKSCQIQIWEDGMLLSDPNESMVVVVDDGSGGGGGGRSIKTKKVGSDRDYDISRLLTNNYAAVEYYPDLASTPPGFRAFTPTCGTLVLWSRMPGTDDQGQTRTSGQAP
jgi:hypothetical protein